MWLDALLGRRREDVPVSAGNASTAEPPPTPPTRILTPSDPPHPVLDRTYKQIMRDYYSKPKQRLISANELAFRLIARFVEEGWTNKWMSPRDMYAAAVDLCIDLDVQAPNKNDVLMEISYLRPLVTRYRPPRCSIKNNSEFKHIRQQYEARGDAIPARPTVYIVRNLTVIQGRPSKPSRPSLQAVSEVMTPVTDRWAKQSMQPVKRRRRAA